MKQLMQPGGSLLLGFPIILIYGLFVRLTFGASYLQDNLGGVVTLGFIFVVPFVLGLLTMNLMNTISPVIVTNKDKYAIIIVPSDK